MTMRPVEVVRTPSTSSQGGVFRFNSHTKEEASMPRISREKREGAREPERWSFQPVWAHGTSRKKVES
jgi:hypothetical protein